MMEVINLDDKKVEYELAYKLFNEQNNKAIVIHLANGKKVNVKSKMVSESEYYEDSDDELVTVTDIDCVVNDFDNYGKLSILKSNGLDNEMVVLILHYKVNGIDNRIAIGIPKVYIDSII